jgi:hypothetical protein
MVLYSSSGWEQQQLERQMKCTINNLIISSRSGFHLFSALVSSDGSATPHNDQKARQLVNGNSRNY